MAETPTTYQPGQSGDPAWEQILADFNAAHTAQFGIPMNRPWSADADAIRQKEILDAQYAATKQDAVPASVSDSGWGGSEVTALVKEQIEYTSRRLTEIEEARKLADMTGTLTSAELKMFDEMEASAVDNLKSQVNAQTEDVWNTALADLINRGVLQGTVGQKILGVISSENVRTIAEGVNTIRGQKNLGELNAMEANKNRAMTWQNMLTQESMGLLGVGQGYAQLASQEASAQLNASTQWNIAGLDAQTKLAVAGMQAGAATTASQYGAWGNLGVAGIGVAEKVAGSDWFGKLVSGGGSGATNWLEIGGNSPDPTEGIAAGWNIW